MTQWRGEQLKLPDGRTICTGKAGRKDAKLPKLFIGDERELDRVAVFSSEEDADKFMDFLEKLIHGAWGEPKEAK